MISGNEILFVILIEIILLILASFSRLLHRSWLAPAPLFTLYWAFFVLIPIIFVPDYRLHSIGILWIFFMTLVVQIGNLITGLGYFKKQSFAKIRYMHFPRLNHLVILCSIIGVLSSIILVISLPKYSSLSLRNLAHISHIYSVLRYSGPYREPELAIFFTSFIYIGSLFGGMLFSSSSIKSSKIISLTPFVPALTNTVVLGTRNSLLIPAVLWIASFLSGVVLRKKSSIKLFRPINILCITIAFLIAITFVVVIQLFRYEEKLDYNNSMKMYYQTRHMWAGSVAAFSQWFRKGHFENRDLGWGKHSLRGPYSLISTIIFSKPIAETRYASLPSSIILGIKNEKANVFTIFKMLIEDFSVIGEILIMFVLGILSGIAYRKTKKGNVMYIPVLTFFYSILIYSIIGNIFAHTTVLFAWGIFCLYFIVYLRKRKYGEI